jgi:hypothetical protein
MTIPPASSAWKPRPTQAADLTSIDRCGSGWGLKASQPGRDGRLGGWHQNCIDFGGRRVQGNREKDTPMRISAILIATAISLTMLVMISDLP